jgi:hypothetical protein
MQIIPVTGVDIAAKMSCTPDYDLDPVPPAGQLRMGLFYLDGLRRLHCVSAALAAYNGRPGNASVSGCQATPTYS